MYSYKSGSQLPLRRLRSYHAHASELLHHPKEKSAIHYITYDVVQQGVHLSLHTLNNRNGCSITIVIGTHAITFFGISIVHSVVGSPLSWLSSWQSVACEFGSDRLPESTSVSQNKYSLGGRLGVACPMSTGFDAEKLQTYACKAYDNFPNLDKCTKVVQNPQFASHQTLIPLQTVLD